MKIENKDNDLSYERSCGAVVFYKFENEYKILVLNFLYGDFSMWGFPKGHMQTNETEIQTAMREIKEETGLCVEIIPEFRATTKFSCKKDIINEAVYFAARSNETNINARKDEKEIVINSKWCGFAEAKKSLTFDCDKNILDKFFEFLASFKI